jgi:hypothetical protein
MSSIPSGWSFANESVELAVEPPFASGWSSRCLWLKRGMLGGRVACVRGLVNALGRRSHCLDRSASGINNSLPSGSTILITS